MTITMVATYSAQTYPEPPVIPMVLRRQNEEKSAVSQTHEPEVIPYLLRFRKKEESGHIQELEEEKVNSIRQRTMTEQVHDLVQAMTGSLLFSDQTQAIIKNWEGEYLKRRDQGMGPEDEAGVLCLLLIKVLIPAMRINKVHGHAYWKFKEAIQKILKQKLPKGTDPEKFINERIRMYRQMRISKVKDRILEEHYENESLSIEKANEINQIYVDGTKAVEKELEQQNAFRKEVSDKLGHQQKKQEGRLEKMKQEHISLCMRADDVGKKMQNQNIELQKALPKYKEVLEG